MHPRSLVERAVARGLDIIAVCDHNASENVGYVISAAKGKALTVVPGMEITSQEEVHVVALFEKIEDLEKIQDVVYDQLPGQNNEKLFGTQAIVNENGEVEGFNERLLIGATRIPLSDIVERIHEFGGLAIASHIDRGSFSVLSQLGFIESESGFDALEISRALGIAGGRLTYPELSGYPFVTSSDAHFIDDIGTGVTRMYLAGTTIDEVKMACEGRNGRFICG